MNILLNKERRACIYWLRPCGAPRPPTLAPAGASFGCTRSALDSALGALMLLRCYTRKDQTESSCLIFCFCMVCKERAESVFESKTQVATPIGARSMLYMGDAACYQTAAVGKWAVSKDAAKYQGKKSADAGGVEEIRGAKLEVGKLKEGIAELGDDA